jgi:hypothetical protein
MPTVTSIWWPSIFQNVNSPKEVSRVEDVFPYTTPPYNEDYRVAQVDEEKGVVIDWEIKKVRQEMEYHYYPVYYRFAKADIRHERRQIQRGRSPAGQHLWHWRKHGTVRVVQRLFICSGPFHTVHVRCKRR